MALSLRPGLTFCEIQHHLIFMDYEADRYFSLTGPARDSLQKLLKSSNVGLTEQEIAPLRAAGIIGHGEGAKPLTPCQHVPAGRSIFDQEGGASRLAAQIPEIIVRLAAMRRTLNRQGLPTILRRLREATPLRVAPGSSAPGIGRLCAAYEASRRYYLPVDHCLIRALALYRHARQRGHDARLVFGVQLHPFSAHSWVEQDDLILDDRVDHVRRFKPILVL